MDAGQPVLIMIQGPEPGCVYKLRDNRVTTIGRSSRNTIRVTSPTVSRFHGEVACINGHWEVNDLNSKKGTMLNGQRIADKADLKPGDLVRLSATVFRFDLVEESALQDSALIAIKEAELDQQLVVKGEGTGTFDEIRLRSRLEHEQARQDRERKRTAWKMNLAFLGAVAFATAALVSGALAYASGGAPGVAGPLAGREDKALVAYEQAMAALEAGDRPGAMALLARMRNDSPSTRISMDSSRPARPESSSDSVSSTPSGSHMPPSRRWRRARASASKRATGRRRWTCIARLPTASAIPNSPGRPGRRWRNWKPQRPADPNPRRWHSWRSDRLDVCARMKSVWCNNRSSARYLPP